MDDSTEYEWLLLLHHLPPKPDYFRVRIRRKLQQLGAVGLKNSAYVLPASEHGLNQLEELAVEIRRDGGEALVARTQWLSGVTGEQLAARFRGESDAAYAEVAAAARRIAVSPGGGKGDAIEKLERRLDEVKRRDLFTAPGQAHARAAVQELRSQVATELVLSELAERPAGAVWVTGQNVSVDGIASAWLITRFIDRKARFRFVSASGTSAPGEVAFAMAGSTYGTGPDHSAFERLLAGFSVGSDAGLAALGELVHDLALKLGGHARAEAPGLDALIQGVLARYASDAERVEQGRRIFDQLYTHFTRLAL